jgi:hypothetical protein
MGYSGKPPKAQTLVSGGCRFGTAIYATDTARRVGEPLKLKALGSSCQIPITLMDPLGVSGRHRIE